VAPEALVVLEVLVVSVLVSIIGSSSNRFTGSSFSSLLSDSIGSKPVFFIMEVIVSIVGPSSSSSSSSSSSLIVDGSRIDRLVVSEVHRYHRRAAADPFFKPFGMQPKVASSYSS